MHPLLRQKCDFLIRSRNTIADTYKWSTDSMNLVAAFLLTAAGRTSGVAELREAEQILKSNTGAFSVFRGNLRVPLLVKMLLSGSPENYLKKVNMIYELQRKGMWYFSAEYHALAAMVLAEHTEAADISDQLERCRKLFAEMKRQHPWLTDEEDMIFAAILAVSGENVEEMMAEAEKNYQLLKGSFRHSNAVQSLSHVLALGDEPAEVKCRKAAELFDGLKQAGHRYGSDYQLPALGTLVLLDIPVPDLVNEICEADDYLAAQKGFGNIRLGSEMRRMYAAQMVLLYRLADTAASENIVLASTLAFMAAAEMASIAAMSASVAVITSTMNS